MIRIIKSKVFNKYNKRYFCSKTINNKFSFNNINLLNQYGIIFLGFSTMFYYFYKKEKIDYFKFVELLKNNDIGLISIKKKLNNNFMFKTNYLSAVSIKDKNNNSYSFDIGNVDEFLKEINEYKIKNDILDYNIELNVINSNEANFYYLLNYSPLLWSTIFISYLFAKKKISINDFNINSLNMNMNKSYKIKEFKKDSNINIKFNDVAGLGDAKMEVEEFVDFLKKPEKYKKIGAKIPKGALLTGPPGTGKTLLAKAVAGESSVPFYYISGSEFLEMYVGVGSSRVRQLFKQAKENSPSIIFIDEIDAIGKKRANKAGGSSEMDSTLNQLLVEMDGFESNKTVIVFSATNRKELLDEALLRPGRFDRIIDINLPDLESRKNIFEIYLNKIKLSEKLNFDKLAKRLSTLTPGFSGADISNICNEAAINAVRKDRKNIEADDFEVAIERNIGGLEKKQLENKKKKKIVSIHECGHAVTSWFLKHGAPLLKLTIIPRSKGSLGFAQYLPNEEGLETTEELFDRIITILGGRCAELKFFGKITTGAFDDLQKAHQIAFNMVTKLGMSDLGYVNYEEDEYGRKYYSQAYNKKIDNEVKNIINKATDKCKELIDQYEKEILNLSNKLLEKETLNLNDIVEILGPKPHGIKENFKKYLEEMNNKDFLIENN